MPRNKVFHLPADKSPVPGKSGRPSVLRQQASLLVVRLQFVPIGLICLHIYALYDNKRYVKAIKQLTISPLKL
jgi:hypothetical protein